MDVHSRRRKAKIGLAYLEEAVLDVLQAAEEEDSEGLEVVQVLRRVGLKADVSGPQHGIVARVLEVLSEDGIAVNARPGPGSARWRLAKTED